MKRQVKLNETAMFLLMMMVRIYVGGPWWVVCQKNHTEEIRKSRTKCKRERKERKERSQAMDRKDNDSGIKKRSDKSVAGDD